MNDTFADFPSTEQRLMEFIQRQFRPGVRECCLSKLVGDASARQYFRYVAHPGESYILATYPEAFDPHQFPYKQVYDLLRGIGLPVPKIIRMDGKLGIVLQQDLGDESLEQHFLTATEQQRKNLLFQTIDYIVAIQQRGVKELRPEYAASHLALDKEKLSSELRFFYHHYLSGYRKSPVENENRLMEELTCLVSQLARYPRLLCHRDYHVRNLILNDNQVYIVDFQDARWGPPLYDLVSLLKDSIQLETQETSEYQDYYLTHSTWQSATLTQIRQDFHHQFHLTCAQRLLKALGTYGYQVTACGNLPYKQYIPGTLSRVVASLQDLEEFPYIRSVMEQE